MNVLLPGNLLGSRQGNDPNFAHHGRGVRGGLPEVTSLRDSKGRGRRAERLAGGGSAASDLPDHGVHGER